MPTFNRVLISAAGGGEVDRRIHAAGSTWNVSADRRIFGGQVLSIAAAALVMASIGTLYTWSIFVAPIEGEFGQSRAASSLVFSAATVAFTVGMFAGPELLMRRRLQSIALWSCLLAAAGLVLSAAGNSVWFIILGFGLMFGLANGLA